MDGAKFEGLLQQLIAESKKDLSEVVPQVRKQHDDDD